MDVNQYLEIFLDETKEHLENLNTQILKLEQEPEDSDTINEIFRAAHSLKGMAGTMGYKRMQALTHDMENVFSEVRNGTMKADSNLIDTLFQCLDALEEYTSTIQETADEGNNDNQQLIDQLNRYLNPGEKKEETKGKAVKEKKDVQEDTFAGKWMNIKVGETERLVFSSAKAQGKNVFGLTVYIQESCLLKAARAFLVYKAVEERAEIIVCSPSAQDIEDEKFDLDFSLLVVSECTLEEILGVTEVVSEIERVVGAPYECEAAPVEEESTDVPAVSTNTVQTTQTQPQTQSSQPQTQSTPTKTNDKKAGGKPVVNRTVRVDIEKLDVLMNLVSELIIAKNSLVSASNILKV